MLDFLFPSEPSPLQADEQATRPRLPDELFSIIARYYGGGEFIEPKKRRHDIPNFFTGRVGCHLCLKQDRATNCRFGLCGRCCLTFRTNCNHPIHDVPRKAQQARSSKANDF